MSRVLNLLLTHQSAPAVARMLDWWRNYCPADDVLVVFNGTDEAFAAIAHPHKISVDHPWLRTRRHSHERQSYGAVWRGAAQWLAAHGGAFTHVHFAEYDHLPLVEGFNARQVARLEEERADVLGFQLARVDGTNQPHFLYHLPQPGFLEHWAKLSVRRDPAVVLSMFGSGSFWTREAFDAVANTPEPFPIYLELSLPTTAHHLGYRLRDWRDQNRHIRSLGDFVDRIEEAPPRWRVDVAPGQDAVEHGPVVMRPAGALWVVGCDGRMQAPTVRLISTERIYSRNPLRLPIVSGHHNPQRARRAHHNPQRILADHITTHLTPRAPAHSARDRVTPVCPGSAAA